jgi:hypothetical protein
VQTLTEPLAISLVAEGHLTTEEAMETTDHQEEEETHQQEDPLMAHQHQQGQMQVHTAPR